MNRTLAFVYKYFDAIVPPGRLEAEIEAKIKELYSLVGALIELGSLKEALDMIFNFVRYSNKYRLSKIATSSEI